MPSPNATVWCVEMRTVEVVDDATMHCAGVSMILTHRRKCQCMRHDACAVFLSAPDIEHDTCQQRKDSLVENSEREGLSRSGLTLVAVLAKHLPAGPL